MKIIIADTNLFISALLYQGKVSAKALLLAADKYTLVLSDSIIDEIKDVVSRKEPRAIEIVDNFLSNFGYSLIQSKHLSIPDGFSIRDPKDEHVVTAAIASESDILLTRDKDFPKDGFPFEVLSPEEFLQKYS